MGEKGEARSNFIFMIYISYRSNLECGFKASYHDHFFTNAQIVLSHFLKSYTFHTIFINSITMFLLVCKKVFTIHYQISLLGSCSCQLWTVFFDIPQGPAQLFSDYQSSPEYLYKHVRSLLDKHNFVMKDRHIVSTRSNLGSLVSKRRADLFLLWQAR